MTWLTVFYEGFQSMEVLALERGKKEEWKAGGRS